MGRHVNREKKELLLADLKGGGDTPRNLLGMPAGSCKQYARRRNGTRLLWLKEHMTHAKVGDFNRPEVLAECWIRLQAAAAVVVVVAAVVVALHHGNENRKTHATYWPCKRQ